VPFKSWKPPHNAAAWKLLAHVGPAFDEPPLPPVPKGMKQGAGVIVREPDGRIWLMHPKKGYGGYKATFPKGTVESDIGPRATAIKEAYEETGLHVRLTGYAGDVKRTTSVGRYYYAERVGGTPADAGWEASGVSLAEPDALHKLLNAPHDKALASAVTGGAPLPPVESAPDKAPTKTDDAPTKAGGVPEKAPANPTKAQDVPDISAWKKVGAQLGSNPGGTYTDPSGAKWYAKQQKSEHHARNEALASALYQAAGSPVVNSKLVKFGDTWGTATPWLDGEKHDIGSKPSQADRDAAAEDFATHAWLSNRDAVGLDYTNQAKIDGKMRTMDVGGALEFRAQGGKKPSFGDTADEWDSLRNAGINPQTHAVYGAMTPAQLKASAAKVAAVPDQTIRTLVDQHGHGDAAAKKALAEKLIARKADIAARAAALSDK
jgi:ADP-ribose pyrophosphatase YjhB (NUDIX family)